MAFGLICLEVKSSVPSMIRTGFSYTLARFDNCAKRFRFPSIRELTKSSVRFLSTARRSLTT